MIFNKAGNVISMTQDDIRDSVKDEIDQLNKSLSTDDLKALARLLVMIHSNIKKPMHQKIEYTMYHIRNEIRKRDT